MGNHLVFFLVALGVIGSAQEARFGIRSIEHNFGVSSTFSNYHDFGLGTGLDITAEYDEHLVALRLNFGDQFDIWSYTVNQYFSLGFLYGREFSIKNWLALEGHVGMGYMSFRKENAETDWALLVNRVINAPISLKVLFVTGKVFRMGINPNINLNSFKILYTMNFVLQFRFR